MLPIAPPTIMPKAMRTVSERAAASRKLYQKSTSTTMRHADEQHGAAAEQAERTVHVAFVRPLQKVRDDEAALARAEMTTR